MLSYSLGMLLLSNHPNFLINLTASFPNFCCMNFTNSFSSQLFVCFHLKNSSIRQSRSLKIFFSTSYNPISPSALNNNFSVTSSPRQISISQFLHGYFRIPQRRCGCQDFAQIFQYALWTEILFKPPDIFSSVPLFFLLQLQQSSLPPKCCNAPLPQSGSS